MAHQRRDKTQGKTRFEMDQDIENRFRYSISSRTSSNFHENVKTTSLRQRIHNVLGAKTNFFWRKLLILILDIKLTPSYSGIFSNEMEVLFWWIVHEK